MKRLILICLCFPGFAAVSSAASRTVDLDTWFEHELAPYVRQQLTTLPRFRNESFRFVVMVDDSPQSEGNALAIGLRNKLRDSVTDIPGIRVSWQADQPGVGLVAGESNLDCTRNVADYYIGVELRETSAGNIDVTVRALDIEERTWVAGFSRSWQGPISGEHRRQLRQFVADPTFRGERNAPWDDSETDLMAAHLAYELGCNLLRQTAGEYVVADSRLDGNIDPTTALVELVSNNLAGLHALRFSADTETSNAIIEGKAHRIDDDLFQYWVTISPQNDDGELATLSADAYVRIPDRYKAATLVPEAIYELPKSRNGFLSAFGVVRMQNQQQCLADHAVFTGASNSGRRFGGADCFALQVRAAGDAVAFFLNHQLNYGLVRLANEKCTQRSQANVARLNEDLRYPLPLDSLQSGAWSAGTNWSLNPSQDAYYVIASTNTKAARALSRHIEKLPVRCSASIRPGLEGDALRRWLEELDAIANHWNSAIDWQSLRVKDVY
jgi:hypothetical protein